MGVVCKAIDLESGKPVAVKFLAPWDPHAGDGARVRPWTSTDLKRFHRECDIQRELSGQGVPGYVHSRLTGARPYLVTEYVDGLDLRALLTQRRPGRADAAAITVQLLRILGRVHSRGVIHRDVKPSNIMIAKDGRLFLVDFGISLPMDPQATRHTVGRTPGSLGFMAPEILQGERSPGPPADLYGAGCTIFLLFAARPVFEYGGNEFQVEYHHRLTPAPRLSTVIGDVSEAMDETVAGLLAKSPSERPTPEVAERPFLDMLPRPGSRGNPGEQYDPKRPFLEGTASAPSAPARGGPTRRPVVRRSPTSGPSRDALRSLCLGASEELRDAGPGDCARRLVDVLPVVRRRWTDADGDVLSALLLCAEAARAEGDWVSAGSRFRAVARQLRGVGPGSPSYGSQVRARLGAVESQLNEDRIPEEAPPDWCGIACEVLELGQDARPDLVALCREVGEELLACGSSTEVAELCERLAGSA
ncbi:serine/threonine-protein kinase [Kitasatospora sp. NA04385]|uniref:serine/threonine-protein kinase n=1 Tax=Kitasatospora sp. NA04385 TaxID=2742135 RepID=UPI0026E04E08|nr:serine/threonine-protein kinase [Kitasatospora sp. NA04385]